MQEASSPLSNFSESPTGMRTETAMNSASSHTASSTNPQIFSPQFLWHTLRHWWKVVVPVSIVLTVIANMAVFYLHVPQFKAFTRLRIKAAPDAILGQVERTARHNLFAENQLAIMKSDLVLEPVIARSPYSGDSAMPVEMLLRCLQRIITSGIIHLLS